MSFAGKKQSPEARQRIRASIMLAREQRKEAEAKGEVKKPPLAKHPKPGRPRKGNRPIPG